MSSDSTSSNSTLAALQNLIEVVAQLRSPDGGCPWDLEQTPQTLIPYIIEEAYEVVAAIQTNDQKSIAEELGDLLLQVVLQAQIASEQNNFTLKAVAQGITDKLIRRHPHVFSDVQVKTIDDVRQNWEQIKAAEKGASSAQVQLLSNQLKRYTTSLPSLIAGMKIAQKAALAGFEWENVAGVWAKFEEELAEFQEALETKMREHQQAELGDLLFTIINIARWYDLDPFDALQGTNRRFIDRISLMEQFAQQPLSDYSLDELEGLWQQAKVKLAESTATE